MEVRVRVIKVNDDLEATEKYIAGHLKVLESYGVTKVTSADRSWTANPNTYLILFESMDDFRVLGGGRIQLRSKGFPLPLEEAIAEIDPSIVGYMEQFDDLEVAEYCGLWNSREVAGYGIGSIYLMKVGVAIAGQFKMKKLMALCSPATVKLTMKVGMEIVESLGQNGTFFYPKEGLIATLLQINDLDNIPTAVDIERQFIFDLRSNKVNKTLEKGPKGEMMISFEVNFNSRN
ncbi:hypothetical protein LV84_03831 [Algoriphagus ratkowskyi]|uniref:Uncharacterized protein n=1 Tax=Algoriphagus ratkowskyi TaxID=57028 RepID=A0A2W7QS31_9BACT|nr:hypothetical protein [Algoriphagus ratkowskyi]PZX51074.1 hypothetical protein LV84_03831 [Algoriphagus ratkowskyi]TXD75863.1 hypothetical protein ESW18_18770 [Algoriphagus ratkowskyi]